MASEGRGGGDTGNITEGSGKVYDVGHKGIAAGVWRQRTWPAKNEWDVNDIVVHHVMFVEHAMTTTHVAVISGVDNEGTLTQPALVKASEDEADGIIKAGDRGEVAGDGGCPVGPREVMDTPCVAHLALYEGFVSTGIVEGGPRWDVSGVVQVGKILWWYAGEVGLGHVPVNEEWLAFFRCEVEPAQDLACAPSW